MATFEPIEALTEPLREIGYEWRQANPELTKRYFQERPGGKRTHTHIRRLGSWHEQWALLFRDYMRAHPEEHAPYVALKRLWLSDTATIGQPTLTGRQTTFGPLSDAQTVGRRASVGFRLPPTPSCQGHWAK